MMLEWGFRINNRRGAEGEVWRPRRRPPYDKDVSIEDELQAVGCPLGEVLYQDAPSLLDGGVVGHVRDVLRLVDVAAVAYRHLERLVGRVGDQSGDHVDLQGDDVPVHEVADLVHELLRNVQTPLLLLTRLHLIEMVLHYEGIRGVPLDGDRCFASGHRRVHRVFALEFGCHGQWMPFE